MSASMPANHASPDQAARSFENAKTITHRLTAASRMDNEPIMDLVFAAALFSAVLLVAKAPSLSEARRALEQINLIADAQLEDMWERSPRP